MLRNSIVVLFLLWVGVGFSQKQYDPALTNEENNASVDTVFIIETVHVRDTVYVIEEKKQDIPTPKKSFKKELETEKVSEEKSSKKKSKSKLYWLALRLKLKGKDILSTPTILNDSGIRDDVFAYEPMDKDWYYGVKTNAGIEENTFFREFAIQQRKTFGLGIWTRRKIFDSNFALGVGLDSYFYYSQNTSISLPNGSIYNNSFVTDDGVPLTFRSIKGNSYQIQAPILLSFSPGRFVIAAGGYVSYCEYSIGMFGISQATGLSELQDFVADVVQIGYSGEVQFKLLTHFSIGVAATYGGFENLLFINKQEQFFKSIDSFKELKSTVNVVYTF